MISVTVVLNVGTINVANMAGELKKIAVVPVESILTHFWGLDKRWSLKRENEIFWSDSESEDEDDFCDTKS